MFSKVATKVFGSRNQRLLRKMNKQVKEINGLEPGLQTFSDEALAAKTAEFRERASNGEDAQSMLVEAFAVVRETSRRVLKERHFDVQLIGGMVLHDGKI
ncbi:MAG: hypothetical protein AAEI92_03560, partial [Arenicellales bacterium]